MGSAFSAGRQLALCVELPALQCAGLRIMLAVLQGVRNHILPHAATISHTLVSAFRRSAAAGDDATTLPFKALLYRTATQYLYALGAGMMTQIAPIVVGRGITDLKQAVPALFSPTNQRSPGGSMAFDAAPNAVGGSGRVGGGGGGGAGGGASGAGVISGSQCLQSADLQIAILEALEALLVAGGPLLPEHWRMEVDAALTCTAAIALGTGGYDSGFNSGYNSGYNSTSHAQMPWTPASDRAIRSLQLAACHALLASLLAPCKYRPPYLGQALRIFRQGRQQMATEVAAFCSFALLALEPVLHPRCLPHSTSIHPLSSLLVPSQPPPNVQLQQMQQQQLEQQQQLLEQQLQQEHLQQQQQQQQQSLSLGGSPAPSAAHPAVSASQPSSLPATSGSMPPPATQASSLAVSLHIGGSMAMALSAAVGGGAGGLGAMGGDVWPLADLWTEVDGYGTFGHDLMEIGGGTPGAGITGAGMQVAGGASGAGFTGMATNGAAAGAASGGFGSIEERPSGAPMDTDGSALPAALTSAAPAAAPAMPMPPPPAPASAPAPGAPAAAAAVPALGTAGAAAAAAPAVSSLSDKSSGARGKGGAKKGAAAAAAAAGAGAGGAGAGSAGGAEKGGKRRDVGKEIFIKTLTPAVARFLSANDPSSPSASARASPSTSAAPAAVGSSGSAGKSRKGAPRNEQGSAATAAADAGAGAAVSGAGAAGSGSPGGSGAGRKGKEQVRAGGGSALAGSAWRSLGQGGSGQGGGEQQGGMQSHGYGSRKVVTTIEEADAAGLEAARRARESRTKAAAMARMLQDSGFLGGTGRSGTPGVGGGGPWAAGLGSGGVAGSGQDARVGSAAAAAGPSSAPAGVAAGPLFAPAAGAAGASGAAGGSAGGRGRVASGGAATSVAASTGFDSDSDGPLPEIVVGDDLEF
ncbi:hypothetical protein CLOM_g16025 [Closterium sp. NIES-68]|nr:hypothetical protein CLOM_g16025 [Closterium sp. NIES-68]